MRTALNWGNTRRLRLDSAKLPFPACLAIELALMDTGGLYLWVRGSLMDAAILNMSLLPRAGDLVDLALFADKSFRAFE